MGSMLGRVRYERDCWEDDAGDYLPGVAWVTGSSTPVNPCGKYVPEDDIERRELREEELP